MLIFEQFKSPEKKVFHINIKNNFWMAMWHLQYYLSNITICCSFDRINAALVSIRDSFKKIQTKIFQQ